MKRNLINLAIFLAVFVCAAHNLAADEACVVSLIGKVEVNRSGKWENLSIGDKVSAGETVSTGFKSEAVFEYKTANQTSTIKLGAVTRIEFSQLVSSGDTDNVRLAMKSGSVQASADKYEGKRVNFTVKNPVATASVRGTNFSVANDGFVSCATGSVFSASASFAGDGDGNVQGGTVVSGGQSAQLSANGIEAGVYDTATSSATSVANTSATASEASGENTSIGGMNAVGARNSGAANAGSNGNHISITFQY